MRYNYLEEIQAMEKWLTHYKVTLHAWSVTKGRVEAQDAIHQFVMLGCANPQEPQDWQVSLACTPLGRVWWNGRVAMLLEQFPRETRLLLEWAKRDKKAVHPVVVDESHREWLIAFLSEI